MSIFWILFSIWIAAVPIAYFVLLKYISPSIESGSITYVLNAMLESINLILDKLHVYPVLLVDTVTVIALSMVVTHHVLQELTIV